MIRFLDNFTVMTGETLGVATLIVIILVIIVCAIFVNIRNTRLLKTVTQPDRGTRAERKLVLKLLKNGIHPKAIFHDLYIRNSNGTFSQIDLVVATPVGILVFEVKDYSGWIFGKGHQRQWTQVLAYGKEKHRFYNPIMQNRTHINNLQKQLRQFENIPFFSIIVFYGSSVFRDISFIPDNTFINKPYHVIDSINLIRNNSPKAGYTNKTEVSNVLQQGVSNGASREIRAQHIENVRNMFWK